MEKRGGEGEGKKRGGEERGGERGESPNSNFLPHCISTRTKQPRFSPKLLDRAQFGQRASVEAIKSEPDAGWTPPKTLGVPQGKEDLKQTRAAGSL